MTDRRPFLQRLMLSATLLLSAPLMAAPPHRTDMDNTLINQLLDTYTRSVSTGDRASFEQLLLDERIPFYGVGDRVPASFVPSLQAVQNYAGFRKAIFESGERFDQTFSDVKIERDGDLAQVSLIFETHRVGADGFTRGWKVLQLLKVGDRWKIASEFYTARRVAVTPG